MCSGRGIFSRQASAPPGSRPPRPPRSGTRSWRSSSNTLHFGRKQRDGVLVDERMVIVSLMRGYVVAACRGVLRPQTKRWRAGRCRSGDRLFSAGSGSSLRGSVQPLMMGSQRPFPERFEQWTRSQGIRFIGSQHASPPLRRSATMPPTASRAGSPSPSPAALRQAQPCSLARLISSSLSSSCSTGNFQPIRARQL